MDDQKCSYTAESIDAWYYRWGRKADLDSSWQYWTDNGTRKTYAWSSNAYRGQYVCISVTGGRSGLYWKDDANSYTGVLVDTSTASASPAAAASPAGSVCSRLRRWWEGRS